MKTKEKLARFQEYYRYLESSFVNTLQIIPLHNEPNTFSPRLYEILQSTCSQIDGIITIMYEEYIANMHEEHIKKSQITASYMYGVLNQDDVFNIQEIVIRPHPDWKAIRPFTCNFKCTLRESDDAHTHKNDAKMPKWWSAYNDSKHKLPEGYSQGNLENTCLALAGLHILHTMMQVRPTSKEDFLKKDSWNIQMPVTMNEPHKHFHSHERYPSSEIFIPLSIFHAESGICNSCGAEFSRQ